MNLLKRYWWAAALLLPGGIVIALVLKARAPKAPVGKDVGLSNTSVAAYNREAAVTSDTQSLVADAKTQADTLRAALANDPLAATLIGVSPSLIASSDPSTVAANASKRADLEQQIVKVQSEITAANAGWADGTHFGGQSPDEFAAIINRYQSQIDGLNAQLAALGS